MDFRNPDYLLEGSPAQKEAWKALRKLDVFRRLSHYDPVLAGTFPLDLTVEGSDLDILCEVGDEREFLGCLREYYGGLPSFRESTKNIGGLRSSIVRFEVDGIPVEIFGQDKPVVQQDAWRHMVVEWALLQDRLKGYAAELKNLKREGLTTEEAFASLIGMQGDPYKGLIALGYSLKLFS